MIVERINNEIVIRIPENIDIELLQDFLDYIKFKTIQKKSQATEKDVEKIAKDINKTWWKKNRNRFITEY